MNIVTSNCTLRFILAASGLMDHFWICVLGHILLTCFGSSQWTNCCLRSSWVPRSDILDEAPVDRLASDPSPPGWGGCVSMIYWCGIDEEDDNEKKWKALRNIYRVSCQDWISSSQLVSYTQHESCYVKLQVAGVSHRLAICNRSVRCCLFGSRDTLRSKKAEIWWMSELNWTFFEGKNVCWYWSQIIPGKIHETNAKNAVMLYG